VNDPVGVPVPFTRLQAAFWTPVPDIEQVLPAGRKPTPVTEIKVPGVPSAGIRVTDGPETIVKIA
jgi:hypothetical protein